MVIALSGSCFCAMGWRYFGNGWRDTEAPKICEAVVLETLNKGRGGRIIVFMVEGKPSAEFSRPRGTFPRGLPVELVVYPGYYGMPWVGEWHAIEKKK